MKITIFIVLILTTFDLLNAQDRIYLANDDHTDYYWRADGPTYHKAFIDMIDYYIRLADSTADERPEYQSRFTCDGSYWMWIYERNKSHDDFLRLIEKIKSGHINVPLNPLINLTGGVPAEAVLRGMYYPGRIERQYQLKFDMAFAIENQTMPLGLVSLFSGSGAKYTWHGVCACNTRLPDIRTKRPHEIFWWKGLDDSKLLMKWYSLPEDLKHNRTLGGYAEARDPADAAERLKKKINTPSYPYAVAGAFGKGWDDIKTLTPEFIDVAKAYTNTSLQVIVSNEKDFFEDFESRYGDSIPEFNASFGNDWDLHMASAQEVVSKVKRATEKLRNAEAMAVLASINNPGLMKSRTKERDECFMNMGIFYEHNWISDSRWVPKEVRLGWSEELAEDIQNYVNTLHEDAAKSLAAQIKKTSENQYFVFNALGWERTDFADLKYEGSTPVHVMDVTKDKEVPSQIIRRKDIKYVRILAEDLPPVGYKIYEIRPGKGNTFKNSLYANATEAVLENQFNRLEIGQDGTIRSIRDKSQNNREFAGNGSSKRLNDLIRQDYLNGDTDDPIHFHNDTKEGTAEIEMLDAGNVSATLTVTRKNPVLHRVRITLFNDINRIIINNEILENFGDALMWKFPFNIDNPEVWHEELGAVIKAGLLSHGGHYAMSHSRYEWMSANHFIDMSEESAGVTISNRDLGFFQLGNSNITHLDTLTATIKMLAGAKHALPGKGFKNQGGYDHFLQRFALTTHNGFNQTNAMKFSLEHQNPLVARKVTGGDFFHETQYSLLRISHPDVLLWALKPAEEGIERGITCRIWNMKKSPVVTNIEGKVEPVQELTHIETPVRKPDNTLKQLQMKTYLLKVKE